MKQGIHPEYVEATVHCSCGETFTTRATKPEIRIEICSKCHPFYSGKQKLVDTGGRVQRFQKKFGDYKAPEKPKREVEEAKPAKAEPAAEEPVAEAAAEEPAAEAPAEEPVAEAAAEEPAADAAEEPASEEAPPEAPAE
jgi:large subunit ribosomal protein L31